MGVLTDIAQRVVGLTKSNRTTDARLGQIENSLKDIWLKLADTDPGADEVILVQNTTVRGTDTYIYILDLTCGVAGTYMNDILFIAGDGIGFSAVPGAPVQDPDGNVPPGSILEGQWQYDDDGNPLDGQGVVDKFLAAGGDLGNWTPTFGGVDMTISHGKVQGASEIGGEPCAFDCEVLTPEEIVAEPLCAAITFAGGPLTVDCAGHVHEMYEHTLIFTESGTEISCPTDMNVIQSMSLDCDATGTDEKVFTVTLNYDYVTVPNVQTGSAYVVQDIYIDSNGYIVTYCCLNFECGLYIGTDCLPCSSSGGY